MLGELWGRGSKSEAGSMDNDRALGVPGGQSRRPHGPVPQRQVAWVLELADKRSHCHFEAQLVARHAPYRVGHGARQAGQSPGMCHSPEHFPPLRRLSKTPRVLATVMTTSTVSLGTLEKIASYSAFERAANFTPERKCATGPTRTLPVRQLLAGCFRAAGGRRPASHSSLL